MATRKSHIDPFDFEEFDEDSGETGGSGTSGGAGGPEIDPALFGLTNYEYLEMIRKEEAKIGKGVPFTKDPNKQKKEAGLRAGGPLSHPLLNNTQRLDGIADSSLDSRPDHNEKSQDKYEELRLQNMPTPKQQHVASPGANAPKLRPGGM